MPTSLPPTPSSGKPGPLARAAGRATAKGLLVETRIEIRAFGERIAYKRSPADYRQAGGEWGGLAWELPPEALPLLAGLGLLALLAGLAQQGALVLVIARPATAGLAAVLTGARRVHRTYSPFGMQQAAVGSATWLPRHFAGHREDEDSGLLYMQARWMDPASGTFLSIDPVVSNPTDPQSVNAYAYARNNPLSNTDPTGACIMADCGRWYGQVPGGMSLSQVSNGYAAVRIGNGLGDGSAAGGIGGIIGGSGSQPTASGTDSSQSGAAGAGSQQGGGMWRATGEFLLNAAKGLGGMLIGAPAQILFGLGYLAYGLATVSGLVPGDFKAGLARIGIGVGYLLAAPLPKYAASTGVLWPGPAIGPISWLQASNFDAAASAWHDQQTRLWARSAPQFGWITLSVQGADGRVGVSDVLGLDPYGQAVRAIGITIFGAAGLVQRGAETAR